MFYPGKLQEGQKLEDVIPKGYAICDGNNGTPNLVGRFIKGTATPAEVKEYDNNDLEQGNGVSYNNSIKIKENNLPSHTHTFNVANNLSIQNHSIGVPAAGELKLLATGNEKVWIPSTLTKSFQHTIQGSITVTQDPNSFTNDIINVEPNYYALIFIMKL